MAGVIPALVVSATIALLFAGIAAAQAPTLSVGFTNEELLKQSPKEQQIYASAAADAIARAIFLRDKVAGACVMNWYFTADGTQFGTFIASAKAYPKENPTTVLIALANRKCKIT